ncbi:sulfate ABC transporter permease subunit CysT [Rhizobium tibeticum]|uniref:sulfate ABC transporter permease subunit CysT n=1 Tax=Rhizobium tibeticum TaxID=501024 RepID=UPI0027D8FB5C|nr:sulfate ABC transporter permease subunit CysT [Rhizobium tibeticum]
MRAHNPTRWRFRRPSVIPGFGMALGLTLTWLTLLILIPLSGLAWRSSELGWAKFLAIAVDPRTLSALRISFGAAFAAACINAAFGVVLAWVLVRYRFPGKRVIDAMVDLPFALPTAVAGIALATLYAPNGWIGQFLTPLGIKIAFTPLGIVIALVFVGLPFVVRTVQPVMEEIDKEVEEAAATLGATRLQTIFRVLLPGLAPPVLTGFALAFARGVGEYGSVIFIAGNLPFRSEIAPLLIVIKLEEYNYAAATGIAAVMLVISFVMLLIINLIQSWSRRRYGYGA